MEIHKHAQVRTEALILKLQWTAFLPGLWEVTDRYSIKGLGAYCI